MVRSGRGHRGGGLGVSSSPAWSSPAWPPFPARPRPASCASGAKPTYYVSVGDSYSVGYQPGVGATTGYTGYVAKKTHLTLANFGCGGATTTSIIDTVGCPDVLPHTAGAHLYPTTTQAAAAEAFLTAHQGHIGLITVSIGGNDVTACAAQANPIPCVGTAVTSIDQNVTTLATGLRAAAGPKVPAHRTDLPRRLPGRLRVSGPAAHGGPHGAWPPHRWSPSSRSSTRPSPRPTRPPAVPSWT